MGSWNVLETIVIADCALEIRGRDLDDLFATVARALADVMVDPGTVSRDVDRTVSRFGADYPYAPSCPEPWVPVPIS